MRENYRIKSIRLAGLIVLVVVRNIFAATEDEMFKRASEYRSNKDYDAAINEYSAIIAINPKSDRAYCDMAAAYLKKGDIKSAIAGYKRVLAINPKHVDGHLNLGSAYIQKGDFDAAIAHYNKAIENNPLEYNAYMGRAVAYINKGNYNRALLDAQMLTELKFQDPAGYGLLGSIYYKKGDIQQALKYYSQALKLDPFRPELYRDRAGIYFDLRQYALSWKDLRRAEILGYKVEDGFLKKLQDASGMNSLSLEGESRKEGKLTVEDTQEMFFAYEVKMQNQKEGWPLSFGRKLYVSEISDDEVSRKMGLQLFSTGSNYGTMVLKDRRTGFFIASGLIGETGILTFCLTDMNKDGKAELVFTHAGGSGEHYEWVDVLHLISSGYVIDNVVTSKHSLAIKKIDDAKVEVNYIKSIGKFPHFNNFLSSGILSFDPAIGHFAVKYDLPSEKQSLPGDWDWSGKPVKMINFN